MRFIPFRLRKDYLAIIFSVKNRGFEVCMWKKKFSQVKIYEILAKRAISVKSKNLSFCLVCEDYVISASGNTIVGELSYVRFNSWREFRRNISSFCANKFYATYTFLINSSNNRWTL